MHKTHLNKLSILKTGQCGIRFNNCSSTKQSEKKSDRWASHGQLMLPPHQPKRKAACKTSNFHTREERKDANKWLTFACMCEGMLPFGVFHMCCIMACGSVEKD